MRAGRIIVLLPAILTMCAAAHAQDEPPPAAPTTTTPATQEQPSETPAAAPTTTPATQEQPSETPAEPARATQTRNPFWPIGYSAPLEISDDARLRAQLEARAQWPKLKYTRPTRIPSGEWVTIIKGHGLKEKGMTVRVEKDGLIYRWEITSIDKNGITAKRLPLLAVRP